MLIFVSQESLTCVAPNCGSYYPMSESTKTIFVYFRAEVVLCQSCENELFLLLVLISGYSLMLKTEVRNELELLVEQRLFSS